MHPLTFVDDGKRAAAERTAPHSMPDLSGGVCFRPPPLKARPLIGIRESPEWVAEFPPFVPGQTLNLYPGTRQQRKRKTEKEIRWKNEEVAESYRATLSPTFVLLLCSFFQTLPLFWRGFFPDRL